MNQEIIDQLKGIFTPVAEKIGQGAEFGYEVVIRQQIAYSIVAVLFAIMGFIGLIVFYKIVKSGRREEHVIVPSYMLLLPAAAISFVWGSIYAILHLINPHYYAIQFFINLVR